MVDEPAWKGLTDVQVMTAPEEMPCLIIPESPVWRRRHDTVDTLIRQSVECLERVAYDYSVTERSPFLRSLMQ